MIGGKKRKKERGKKMRRNGKREKKKRANLFESSLFLASFNEMMMIRLEI